MRRVLVTGGAGFIGSHLVDRLISEGYSVRIIDNFSTGRMENLGQHAEKSSQLEIIRGDLKNPKDIEESIRDVDVVFHYAANPEVRVSTTSPEVHFNENIVATFNLLEAMRKNGVKELVFASSSTVYGEPETLPVNEDAPMRPVSVYGATKASCENLIHAYSKLNGIRAVVLRYANVVGPRLRHGILFDLLMKLMHNKKKLEVLGDGTQTRSYIYIKDAIEATLLSWRKSVNSYNIYNIASNDWIDVKTIVSAVLKELRMEDTEIEYKPVLHGVGWPGDVKKIALDISKLKKLGFQPEFSSIEALKVTVKHLVEELKLDFSR